jgi:hypothetical protein
MKPSGMSDKTYTQYKTTQPVVFLIGELTKKLQPGKKKEKRKKKREGAKDPTNSFWKKLKKRREQNIQPILFGKNWA